MRFTTTFFLASFLIGTAACAASGSNGAPTEAGKPQPNGPGSGNGETPNPQPKEPPLTPRAVCDTIATDTYFGRGCSGSGSGQEVCAFESASCGTNECVYDTRKADTFAFYCAPKCNAANNDVCPLGYECVAPTASCAGNAEDGVCVRNAGYECKDIGDASGTFVEGPDGALLSLKWTGSQGSLRQRTSNGWRTLTTWSDTSSSGYVYGIARADARLLIVTSGYEILVEGNTAKATKRIATTSYAPTVGVAADGSFVSLELTSGSYATVSRRSDDGKWSEVGPTRKRIAQVAALGRGFIARCGTDLCISTDGETYATIAAPDDVVIEETTRFVAAGASTDDFYFSVDGRLFHHRKGDWVEEGPRGTPKSDTGSYYQDTLRVSSTGTVAFHTHDATRYVTYAVNAGGDCWKTTTADNLNNATLVGDSLAWATYSSGDLCTLKVE